MEIKGQHLIISSVIVFAAAVIFAGVLVWYGNRVPSSSSVANFSMPMGTTTSRGPAPGVPVFHQQVVGAVTAVGANNITVAALTPAIAGAPQSNSTISTLVNISSGTSIYKEGALLSQAQYQQEIAAFQQKTVQSSGANVVYVGPDQYAHVALQVSDVHVGDFVVVIPTTDATPGQTVTASSIQVTPAPGH